MSDITLEKVIRVCGQYTSKTGSNYYFRCPICASEGHDKHGDNLVFNETKTLLKCFADESHSKDVLRDINRIFKPEKQEQNYKTKVNIVKQWEINKEKYLEYMLLTNEYLLEHDELLEYLYNKRKIRKETVEICGIGYDYTENSFIFPIYSIKHDCLVDFELRKKSDKKQIRRVGGGCNTIACIYGGNKADTLIINEGFIDGILMTQYLLFDKKITDFTVYSCSNGVSSLFSVLNEINFNNFKTIKLILDCDKAGDESTQKIIEKYPFIKDSRKFIINKNCKDFCEWYINKGE